MKAYEDPTLPENAPEWARVYCSAVGDGMHVSMYQGIRAMGIVTRELGYGDLVEIATNMPPLSLVRFQRASKECQYDRSPRYGALLAIGQDKRRNEPTAALCFEPIRCEMEATDHLHVPVSMCTILGCRHGVTPEVMRAIYEGRPYEEVRAMTLAPNLRN